MKSLYDVIKAPLITEKGSLVSETSNQLVFRVSREATKEEIKRAVEKLFDVKVDSVRTTNYLGKTRKRFGKVAGRRADWKKAYAKLQAGESLDLLDQA